MGWALKKLQGGAGHWVPAFRAGPPIRPADAPQRGGGPVGQAPALDTFPPLFAEVGTPFDRD
jgi:hypothetical protein